MEEWRERPGPLVQQLRGTEEKWLNPCPLFQSSDKGLLHWLGTLGPHPVCPFSFLPVLPAVLLSPQGPLVLQWPAGGRGSCPCKM